MSRIENCVFFPRRLSAKPAQVRPTHSIKSLRKPTELQNPNSPQNTRAFSKIRPNAKMRIAALTAEVIVPPTGAEGVIVALGGIIGGWSLYAKGGKLKYCYNFYGVNRYTIEGASAIPPGTHQVRMEFKYDGGGLAKGGAVTLYVDGGKVGEGRVDMTSRWCSRPTRPAMSATNLVRP